MKYKKALCAAMAAFMICAPLYGCGRNKAKADEDFDSSETVTFGGESDPTSTDQVAEAITAAAIASSEKDSDTASGAAADVPIEVVEAELSDAQSFAAAGMYSDAQEMLDSVDKNTLSEEDLAVYEDIQIMIEQAQDSPDGEFTPDDAIQIVESRYGVTMPLDTSGLNPETDSDGRQYYRMQVEFEGGNIRMIVDVYEDGTVNEISSEPISFG